MGKRLLNDTPELIESFRKDFLEDNYSIKQLCEKHSCSSAVIQRFLKKHGIKRIYKYQPSSEDIIFITQEVQKGTSHKDIAQKLQVPSYRISSYIKRNIVRTNRYSNELSDTSWVNNSNPLYWYVLGLLASDGHLSNYNEISFFQKDGRFIKMLQKWIHHTGVLYGKSCYVIHINSAFLHAHLQKLGFRSDKRYSVPFIQAPTDDLQWMFVRGLFDGDGSLYFNFVSGRFEGLNWQITSGSEQMAKGLFKFLKKHNLPCYQDTCLSAVGNSNYRIGIRSLEGIKMLFPLLYKSEFLEYKMPRKYGLFLKILEIIKMNKQVDDIVEAAMKIAN